MHSLSALLLLSLSTLTLSQDLPSFVTTFAPLSHLYSEEKYWPSDIVSHASHTTPEVDFEAIASTVSLSSLNSLPTTAYLTSNDEITNNPTLAWLTSTENTPSSSGLSAAPATIVAVNKTLVATGEEVTDAFYFYFYSYDHGNSVLDIDFGDHVGDWEHTMVRFSSAGEPQFIYLSAHGAGTAYAYSTLINSTTSTTRAVTYIGTGTHANYATAGEQDYSLPLGLLHDTTDNGPIWDVSLNYRGFWFNNSTMTFTEAGNAGGASDEGTSWIQWLGKWGDQQYPDSHDDQYCLFDECHWVDGPTGPLAKNLGRNAVCQTEDGCEILSATEKKIMVNGTHSSA